jgi:hypothetical protein
MMFTYEEINWIIYLSIVIYVSIGSLFLFIVCCSCRNLQKPNNISFVAIQDREQLKDSIYISRELRPLVISYIEEEDDIPNDVFYDENEEIDNRYTII